MVLQRTRIEKDVPVERLYELAVREGNSKKPVYEIHKWWARRLGSVFRMLLLLATAPEEQSDEEVWSRFYAGDDLSHLRMLDPFMGGGTSIVEATKLRLQTVGVDIDPVAWFVTRQEVNDCRIEDIEAELAKLEASDVVARIKQLYRTSVPLSSEHSDNGSIKMGEADVVYNFWVDLLTCHNCNFIFEAHNHYKLLYHPKKSYQTVFCKFCHQSATLDVSDSVLHCKYCAKETKIDVGTVENGVYSCPKCNYKGRVVDVPKFGLPLSKRWFAIEYVEPTTSKRMFKTPDAYDLERYAQAERILSSDSSSLLFPCREIPLLGREDLRPTTHGYAFYHQLFNARQLLTLSWLLEWISKIEVLEIRNYFVLAFSDALAANNMLCSFAYGYDKLTPLFGLHAYNMISRPVENNVWGAAFGRGSFVRCLRKVLDGKKYCLKPYESRYNQSNGNLEKVFVQASISSNVVTTAKAWYEHEEDQQMPRSLLLNQSSQNLKELRDKSIHIILTDPPYYNNLSYSELSDFYYAWIQPFLTAAGATWSSNTTPYNEALFVKQRTNVQKSISEFIEGLHKTFNECYRVLDDEGLFIFTYHHLDVIAWVPLAKALLGAKFVIKNVFPVRSEGRGKFHSTEGTVKWDAVIVCRKLDNKFLDEHYKGPDVTSWHKEQGIDVLAEMLAAEAQKCVDSWQIRFEVKNIPFAWPDALSLMYAFTIQGLTQLSVENRNEMNMEQCLTRVYACVMKYFPDSVQKRIRKRKSKLPS